MLQTLVVPHAERFGVVAMRTEFFAGAILLVTEARGRAAAAGQTARSMVTSRWRPWSSATAAFVLGAMSLSIYVLQDGRLPGINPGSALASPIALELFLVPLAPGVAWLQFARFRALRAAAP